MIFTLLFAVPVQQRATKAAGVATGKENPSTQAFQNSLRQPYTAATNRWQVATRLNTQLTRDTVINPIEPKVDVLPNKQQPNTPLTTTESTIQRQSSDPSGHFLAPSIPFTMDGQRSTPVERASQSFDNGSTSKPESKDVAAREMSVEISEPSSNSLNSQGPFKSLELVDPHQPSTSRQTEPHRVSPNARTTKSSFWNLFRSRKPKERRVQLSEQFNNELKVQVSEQSILSMLSPKQLAQRTELTEQFINKQKSYEISVGVPHNMLLREFNVINQHIVEISQIKDPIVKDFFLTTDKAGAKYLVILLRNSSRFLSSEYKIPMELLFKRAYKLTKEKDIDFYDFNLQAEFTAIREKSIDAYAAYANYNT